MSRGALTDKVKVVDRVVVTKSFVGICHMQVCAVKDATDEEILEVCNRVNPSGTSAGWGVVVRDLSQAWDDSRADMLPVECSDYKGRLHFLVGC